jgi:K+-sensing histidine kinase KdpD
MLISSKRYLMNCKGIGCDRQDGESTERRKYTSICLYRSMCLSFNAMLFLFLISWLLNGLWKSHVKCVCGVIVSAVLWSFLYLSVKTWLWWNKHVDVVTSLQQCSVAQELTNCV